ncbi:glycosyltransferase family 2 protein [Cryobacterium sp. MDB1-18-2]|uniref:glycosyltransferase family A protein n=1 Tax=unclassified Cryobacterium TaxID=2649013 RepID=UPI001068EDBA|nr:MULTISPECIES: glycosyltransferase family A protein [unclassified Cryobacterium]TFC11899.1 glycosyltransferase family 2 protein [Cryobacterium sp. MDB2-33-2]TFC24216.1 glycosyltransferase family 2 protein [Cryobacterium sp. MDB1-18-2]TFC43138.1 glycosyltransferase family 2 protein [Cryobacterium sp. MDB1-18-1]
MYSGHGGAGVPDLSVVIPTYNSAEWLPTTIAALVLALSETSWTAEIIVVNDGSTDATIEVLESQKSNSPYPLRIVNQENKGRFMARWEGIQSASSSKVFVLDSRVLIHESALAHLESALVERPGVMVWNGHVITDPTAPLVGRFWEVPTFLFWGRYLAHPRPTLITKDNFDRLPKGTGCLLLPKDLYERACLASWPSENAHLVSDDTKLLRFIIEETPILLDPEFSATYRPRVTFRGFLSHSRGRGTLFVDSYAGTSTGRDLTLILLAILPPLVALGLAAFAVQGLWVLFAVLLATGLGSILAPFLIASARGCPLRAGASYLCYIVPFGLTFWAGLVRGILVHRKSFQFHKQFSNGANT